MRNLVGANMSFRREALIEAGGFRHELGRIGKIPAGAEETDLCDPGRPAEPRHARSSTTPRPRSTTSSPPSAADFDYFISRCRGEGRSKAILAGLVGSDDGLSEERSYTSRTLPLGFLRGIGDAFRGDVDGLARAAMLVVGLAATTGGYLGGQGEAKRIARRREQAESSSRPLRVLMVTPRSPLLQGGVERHVMETSRRIAAAGAEVEVLCTEPGGPKLAEEVRDGVTIRTVRSWPADRDWCLAPRLWREMSRRPWDVVHVQSYHTLVAPLAMLRALTLRIPYVVTFHGGGHSQAHRNRARTSQRRLLRPLLARAARLVAVARFEIDEYGGELGLGPDHFVADPQRDRPRLRRDRRRARAATAPPTIASIGRLERYKGHHRVIEAFPEVLRRKPETTLSVVGSGPYEDELRRLAAELGVAERVVFTSTPADQPRAMAELLSGISVVVLMSEFETHPLVALEAAAAGCRLLVADASGLGELAREGFARAIPLDEDPAAIGRAVVEELGKPPQQKRPELSSWDECAERLLELYGVISHA